VGSFLIWWIQRLGEERLLHCKIPRSLKSAANTSMLSVPIKPKAGITLSTPWSSYETN
jgi:hypothetical protein